MCSSDLATDQRRRWTSQKIWYLGSERSPQVSNGTKNRVGDYRDVPVQQEAPETPRGSSRSVQNSPTAAAAAKRRKGRPRFRKQPKQDPTGESLLRRCLLMIPGGRGTSGRGPQAKRNTHESQKRLKHRRPVLSWLPRNQRQAKTPRQPSETDKSRQGPVSSSLKLKPTLQRYYP